MQEESTNIITFSKS